MKKEEKKEVVKRKFKFTKALIVFLILYLFCFFVYKAFTFKITNIFILNNSYLTDQEVIDDANLRNYPSFMLTSKRKIKNNLLKNDMVKNVTVTKKLFGKIYIDITESIPLFYDENSNKTILENGKEIDTDKYIISSLKSSLDSDMLEKLVNKYIDVNDEVRLMISEIKYVPNDIDKERFILTMNDGNYVYVTLYKMSSINEYIKILTTLENKKGILYLDSGNYFEIFKS